MFAEIFQAKKMK